MKDHEIRELVNQLRDVAIKYHGAGQLREQIASTVRAAMLQAQSDDDGEPTDDERIMAIEGIHSCERCGDEGWVVGEMGITRCACGQAGNSPVIPDRWIPVSERMPEAGGDMIVFTDGIVMSGVSYAKKKGFYIQALEYDDDEPVDSVTHWMPLPAAPQEVKGE